MLLDEKETYRLTINKWRIGFNLLIISYFYYKVPMIIYRKWQFNTLSSWSIIYIVLAIIMSFITIRLLWVLFSNGLIVEMGDLGIKTKQFGFMDWNTVQDINVTKDKVLLIFLTHPKAFSETLKVSQFQQKVMESFDKKKGTPFAIQVGETNYKAVEFEAALAQFRKKDPSV
jgi:hypothetical protein